MTSMTMKQACALVEERRRKRSAIHRAEVTKGDFCKPFTEKEWKKTETRQKSTFAKSRAFTHNRMWRENANDFTV